jgi:hypothetical protein
MSRMLRVARKVFLLAILCSPLLVLPLLGPIEKAVASGQVSCNECVRQCKAAGGTSMECLAQCAASQCY